MAIIEKNNRFGFAIAHTDKITKGRNSNFRFCLDSNSGNEVAKSNPTVNLASITSTVGKLAKLITNASQGYTKVQGSLIIHDTLGYKALPDGGYKDRMPKTIVLGSSDEGMDSVRVKIGVPGFAPVMQVAPGDPTKPDDAATTAKFQALCSAVAALGLHDWNTGCLLDKVISGSSRMIDEFRADDTEQSESN